MGEGPKAFTWPCSHHWEEPGFPSTLPLDLALSLPWPSCHLLLKAQGSSLAQVLLVLEAWRGAGAWAWGLTGGWRMTADFTDGEAVMAGTCPLNGGSFSTKASEPNHGSPLGRSRKSCSSPINMMWALFLVRCPFTVQHFFAELLYSNDGLHRA